MFMAMYFLTVFWKMSVKRPHHVQLDSVLFQSFRRAPLCHQQGMNWVARVVPATHRTLRCTECQAHAVQVTTGRERTAVAHAAEATYTWQHALHSAQHATYFAQLIEVKWAYFQADTMQRSYVHDEARTRCAECFPVDYATGSRRGPMTSRVLKPKHVFVLSAFARWELTLLYAEV